MIELDETTSTNSFLRDYRPLTPVDITLVTAEYQTAGRGQATNIWESERSQNLLFSLQVQPATLSPDRVFALSEAIALSIKEGIEREPTSNPSPREGNWLAQGSAPLEDTHEGEVPVPVDVPVPVSVPVTVKWPNDIYVGDCKIAGILIENDFQGSRLGRCIIGCGVNINQTKFAFPNAAQPVPISSISVSRDSVAGSVPVPVPVNVPVPTSLALLLGHPVERRFVLEAIIEAFKRRYEAIQSGRPDALAAIHADYLAALYRRTGLHPFCDANGPFRAEIADVEPTGHLILRDADGQLRRYAFKEVAYMKEE